MNKVVHYKDLPAKIRRYLTKNLCSIKQIRLEAPLDGVPLYIQSEGIIYFIVDCTLRVNKVQDFDKDKTAPNKLYRGNTILKIVQDGYADVVFSDSNQHIWTRTIGPATGLLNIYESALELAKNIISNEISVLVDKGDIRLLPEGMLNNFNIDQSAKVAKNKECGVLCVADLFLDMKNKMLSTIIQWKIPKDGGQFSVVKLI